jgi:DNA-binding MarR family transcriptional regulator
VNENLPIGALLWRLTMRWRAAVDRALAPVGLTHAQYSLLASLYGLSRSGTAPSQRQLADFAELDTVYVSKLIRSLEAAGLVTRGEHPDDTRAVQLQLTSTGSETIQRAIGIVRQLHEQLTAPIGGPTGARTRELAQTLRALLGAPYEGERP